MDVELREPCDQESLVFILRINKRVRIRCVDGAEFAELDVRRFSTAKPTGYLR